MKTLQLIAPRGYCAGVERAIETVERALDARGGGPVYVRGEIVHNKHVVAGLAERGAVFVADESEVPEGETLVLSAHGSAPEVYRRADARGLAVIDATCPLVSKVHAEVRRYAKRDLTVLLVGHAGHDEVVGTMGEAPEHVRLVQTVAEAEAVEVPDPDRVALATQTTLSLDETAEIVATLRRRFPALQTPPTSDICYATQNRQDAVRGAVGLGRAELVMVVGSRNSSNSLRLVEVAQDGGADAYLIDDAGEIDDAWLAGRDRVALTAGASAPERLVTQVADRLRAAGYDVAGVEDAWSEGTVFALPRAVR